MAEKGHLNIVYMVMIAGRKDKDSLLNELSQLGTPVIDSLYGKGSVKASCLMDAFGFVPEENKILITCLLSQSKAEAAFEMLLEKFDFNKPNTGIAFTVPVNNLTF